jgi:hypothetical protein
MGPNRIYTGMGNDGPLPLGSPVGSAHHLGSPSFLGGWSQMGLVAFRSIPPCLDQPHSTRRGEGIPECLIRGTQRASVYVGLEYRKTDGGVRPTGLFFLFPLARVSTQPAVDPVCRGGAQRTRWECRAPRVDAPKCRMLLVSFPACGFGCHGGPTSPGPGSQVVCRAERPAGQLRKKCFLRPLPPSLQPLSCEVVAHASEQGQPSVHSHLAAGQDFALPPRNQPRIGHKKDGGKAENFGESGANGHGAKVSKSRCSKNQAHLVPVTAPNRPLWPRLSWKSQANIDVVDASNSICGVLAAVQMEYFQPRVCSRNFCCAVYGVPRRSRDAVRTPL